MFNKYNGWSRVAWTGQQSHQSSRAAVLVTGFREMVFRSVWPCEIGEGKGKHQNSRGPFIPLPAPWLASAFAKSLSGTVINHLNVLFILFYILLHVIWDVLSFASYKKSYLLRIGQLDRSRRERGKEVEITGKRTLNLSCPCELWLMAIACDWVTRQREERLSDMVSFVISVRQEMTSEKQFNWTRWSKRIILLRWIWSEKEKENRQTNALWTIKLLPCQLGSF